MTERRNIQWALNLAIEVLENPWRHYDICTILEAAYLLKGKGPEVTKGENVMVVWCTKCNTPASRCTVDHHHNGFHKSATVTSQWTERTLFKPVT